MASNHRRHAALLASLSFAFLAAGCTSDAETGAGGGADIAEASPGGRGPSRGRSPKAATEPAGTPLSFRTVGPESGFAFERYDDIRGQRRILEANGGGVALFDYDRDGRVDAFLTNGCRLPLKLGDRESRGELLRNRGGMRFESAAGESRLVQFGYTHGCALGDYDADGFDDLYVTAFGRNALWRNNGDGTFVDVTAETGTEVPAWSSSAAFADVNGDGHLDLYVANYLDESDESPKLCPNPASPDGYEQCSPAMFEGVDDVLFLSDGRGGLIDATAAAGIAGTRGKGLGVVIGDLDGDRRPEIYVANDGEANFLFVPVTDPAGGGRDGDAGGAPPVVRFVDRAITSGVALSEAGYAQASMGIAAGDHDGDGTPDLFLTNFFGDTSTLYANRGGLVFEDETRSSNLAAPSRQKLGWGTAFIDADNDGRLDLLVANGHVEDRTWMSHGEPYRMRPQVFRNAGGRFADVSAGAGDYFATEWVGRGLALGDLDRDGRIDAVVSHQAAPSVALRNETPTDGGAVVLRFVGTSSNRNGYGTRVEVVDAESPTVRELFGGGSFQSAHVPEIHLGLGTKTRSTVRVYWPSGIVETYADLHAGDWAVVEGRGVTPLRSRTPAPGPH